MIPENVRAEIIDRLKKAEVEHAVRILFAIDSGSRAWCRKASSISLQLDRDRKEMHALDCHANIESSDTALLPQRPPTELGHWQS